MHGGIVLKGGKAARFTRADRLAEQFYSLQSHLEAGGGFSFAVDEDKKFAAFVTSYGGTAARKLFAHMDPILSEYGAHGLAADDVIHLQSFGAGGRREELQVYTVSSDIFETKTTAIYDHRMPIMARHRDFFPFLVWPQDQASTPILTSDHRISYTLDMTCEVYPGNVHAAFNKTGPSGSNMPSLTGPRQSGITLDDLHVGPMFADSFDLDAGSPFDVTLEEMAPLDRAVNSLDKFR